MVLKHNNGVSILKEKLLWFLQTAGEFTRLKPKCSILMMLLLLLTQVMALLTLIVPMKMIFILAEEPYTPKTLFSYTFATKQELAIFFLIVVAGMAVFTLWSGRFMQTRERKCSGDIWKNKRKFMVYANQDRMASDLYRRFLQTLMNLGMVALILVVILYIFPQIALVFLLYWGGVGAGLVWLYERKPTIRTLANERLGKLMGTLDLFGFFTAFCVLAYDFAFGESEVDMIWGVIALILLRRAMNAISATVVGVKSLFENREKIETIFFSGQITGNNLPVHKDTKLWDLFEPPTVKSWLRQVLEDVTGSQYWIDGYKWLEMGMANEFAFKVTARREGAERAEDFLVKLFSKSIHAKAEREFAVLGTKVLSRWVLPFLGVSTVEENPCHVFRYLPLISMEHRQFVENRALLQMEAAETPLPQRLTGLYTGAHKLIYERIDPRMLERLKVVATLESDREKLRLFEMKLSEIRSVAAQLPLRMVLQNLTPNLLKFREGGQPVVLSLAHWQIEPLGFGFAVESPSQRKQLEEIVAVSGNSENEREVIMASASIVSHLAELEGRMRRHLFLSVLESVEEVLNLLESISTKGLRKDFFID